MSGESLSGGKVTLGIVGDASNFGSQVAADVEASSGGGSGHFAALGKKMGGLILSGFAAIGIGTAIGEYVKSGIEEYQAFDAMQAGFASSLQKGGSAANVTKGHMTELATSLSEYSGQAVTSIGASEKLLLGFHNIKNSGTHKVFDDATKASMNMAQAFGGTAASQAQRLGRALSDPAKGMTALRREGILFTDGQQKTIKAMVATGNVAGAQEMILRKVASVTGDAAGKFANTLPGAIARSKVAVGEMNRALVSAFLPVLTPIINGVANLINDKAIPAIEKLTDKIANDAIPKFKSMAKGVEDIGKVFAGKKLDIGPWTQPVAMLGSAFRTVFNAIKGNAGGVLKELVTGLGRLGTSLAPVVLAVLKFVAATSPLGAVLKGIGPVLPQLINLIAKLGAQLSGSLIKVLTALQPSLALFAKALSTLVGSTMKAALPVITDLAKTLSGLLTHNQGAITQFAIGMVQIATALIKLVTPLIASKAGVQTLIAAFLVWKAVGVIAQVNALEKALVGQIKTLALSTAGVAKNVAAWAAAKAFAVQYYATLAKDAVVNAAKATAAWVKAAAQQVASGVKAAAGAVANAAKATAAWVASAAKRVAADAKAVAGAVVNGAKVAAVAVANAAKATAAWVASSAKIIATYVAQAAAAVANGAKIAAVWVAQTAKVIAFTVAQNAVKVATGIATAAQWLFNAALDANPIGVVVVAIAALVAALVWFFTQTKLGKAVWQDISTFMVNTWNTIVAVAKVVWKAIEQAVTVAINAAKAVISTVLGWISTFWSAEVKAWQLIITTVFNAIKAVVTGVINGVKAVINTVIGWITAFWNAEVKGWQLIITTVFNAVKAVVSTVIGVVRGVISGAVGFITGVWTTGWNLVLNTAKTIMSNVVTAVSGAIKNVIAFFTALGGNIIKAIGNAGSMLVTVGGQIIQGLINGIKNAGAGVLSAITGVANGAINAAKAALGIKSPSVVFKSIGDFLGKGLVVGIKGTHDQVVGAMNDLTTKIKDSFTSLVAKRTEAQKKLKKLDQELGDVTGIKAAANKRRAVLEGEIADQKKAVAELTKESSKKTETTILNLIKRDNKSLAKEANRRDAIGEKLKTAQDNLNSLLSAKSSYGDSVSAAVISAGSVMDSFKAVDSARTAAQQQIEQLKGDLAKLDKTSDTYATDAADLNSQIADQQAIATQKATPSILAKLQKTVTDTKTFQNVLGQLVKAGLDNTTYDQLVQAGVDGGGLDAAQELLSSGADNVKQVASLQAQLKKAADSLGSSTSGQMYNAGIATAQGIVKGLQSQEDDLTKAMDHLGDLLVSSIKKKLDIHSPSRVMGVLGGFVGEGFANGIEGSAPKVTKAMAGLGGIPMTTSARFNLGQLGGAVSGTGTTIVNQFNGQMGFTADEVVGKVTTAQRRAQARITPPRVTV